MEDVFFHQWPLNGYIHKIHHGDWFGGKGVGLCRIRCGDTLVNVYCTHVSWWLILYVLHLSRVPNSIKKIAFSSSMQNIMKMTCTWPIECCKHIPRQSLSTWLRDRLTYLFLLGTWTRGRVICHIGEILCYLNNFVFVTSELYSIAHCKRLLLAGANEKHKMYK